MNTTDGILAAVMRACGRDLKTPVERMPYDRAMESYGTDRPDLRFGCMMATLDEIFAGTGFRVFAEVLSAGGSVRGMRVDGGGSMSRSRLDGWVKRARELGSGGLIWLVAEPGGLKSPVAGYLSDEEKRRLRDALRLTDGDAAFLVAGGRPQCDELLHQLRGEVASSLNLADEGVFRPVWVPQHFSPLSSSSLRSSSALRP